MSGSPTCDTEKNRKSERGEFITPPRLTSRRSNYATKPKITRMKGQFYSYIVSFITEFKSFKILINLWIAIDLCAFYFLYIEVFKTYEDSRIRGYFLKFSDIVNLMIKGINCYLFSLLMVCNLCCFNIGLYR